MTRWIVVGVEILLQMMLGLGIFLRIYGSGSKKRKWQDYFIIAFMACFYLLIVNGYTRSLVSTSAVIFITIIEILWLAMWIRGHFLAALCWCFFYNCTIMLLEMPILILCGLLRNGTLGEVNNQPNFFGSFLKMLLLMLMAVIYLQWRDKIEGFLTAVLEKKKWVLFLFGLLAMFFTIYLMNLVYFQFNVWALVMNLVLVLCMFLGLVAALVWTQYISVKRENRMYLSREVLLQSNYEIIKKEQEKNRKINHDHRYDLTYLYDCFQEKDWEKGKIYIEQKLEQVRKKRENEVWTGCSCIDFLISGGRQRAKERGFDFIIDVDLAGIPIEEYALFTILGNLLDNAFEAAEKCREEKGYVKLKIHTVNCMMILSLENSYQEEPQRRKGKFISAKHGEGEHGWGIENVKEIVEKNDGMMKVEYSDHVFNVWLMLGI